MRLLYHQTLLRVALVECWILHLLQAVVVVAVLRLAVHLLWWYYYHAAHVEH